MTTPTQTLSAILALPTYATQANRAGETLCDLDDAQLFTVARLVTGHKCRKSEIASILADVAAAGLIVVVPYNLNTPRSHIAFRRCTRYTLTAAGADFCAAARAAV